MNTANTNLTQIQAAADRCTAQRGAARTAQIIDDAAELGLSDIQLVTALDAGTTAAARPWYDAPSVQSLIRAAKLTDAERALLDARLHAERLSITTPSELRAFLQTLSRERVAARCAKLAPLPESELADVARLAGELARAERAAQVAEQTDAIHSGAEIVTAKPVEEIRNLSAEVMRTINTPPSNKDQWWAAFWRAHDIAKTSAKAAKIIMESLAGNVPQAWGLTLDTSNEALAEIKHIQAIAQDQASKWASLAESKPVEEIPAQTPDPHIIPNNNDLDADPDRTLDLPAEVIVPSRPDLEIRRPTHPALPGKGGQARSAQGDKLARAKSALKTAEARAAHLAKPAPERTVVVAGDVAWVESTDGTTRYRVDFENDIPVHCGCRDPRASFGGCKHADAAAECRALDGDGTYKGVIPTKPNPLARRQHQPSL